MTPTIPPSVLDAVSRAMEHPHALAIVLLAVFAGVTWTYSRRLAKRATLNERLAAEASAARKEARR